MPNILIDYKKYISPDDNIFDPNKNLKITLIHVWEQNNYLRKNLKLRAKYGDPSNSYNEWKLISLKQ